MLRPPILHGSLIVGKMNDDTWNSTTSNSIPNPKLADQKLFGIEIPTSIQGSIPPMWRILDLYQTRKQQWNSTMFRLHRWILQIDIRRTTDSWTFSFRSTPPTPPSTWIAQPMCFREDFALAGYRGTNHRNLEMCWEFASARFRSDFWNSAQKESSKVDSDYAFKWEEKTLCFLSKATQKWSFKAKQITVFVRGVAMHLSRSNYGRRIWQFLNAKGMWEQIVSLEQRSKPLWHSNILAC